ncbi:hypothetical protein J1N35_034820 [Gossypium stocksii]|uniref:Uncharacterized protein n=1 Tax=Gossypium stocksii TaxID=47602 RepID=A0A9D3ZR30_9ROSI|nr:hypothetical protein J1N35_034820 [Gossypium stocksii]
MNRSDSENESNREDDVFLNDDEISIHEDDVQICLDGKYPDISFLERVHDLIDQSLHYRYYGKGLLKIIEDVVGQVMKVDYNTTLTKRGRFARIVIFVDLNILLVTFVGLDGVPQHIEYEGLPTVCCDCGRFGHKVRVALIVQKKKRNKEVVDPMVVENIAVNFKNEDQSLYGP